MSKASASTESPLLFLWRKLGCDEQRDAVQCFWAGPHKSEQKEVAGVLAMMLNYRDKFVRERPLEWKVQELSKRICRSPLSEWLDVVLRAFLIERRKEMICAILDAEGTPHEDVWTAEDAPTATVEVLVRGLQGVRGKYADRDLLIYYTVHLCLRGRWEALREAIETPEFEDLLNAVFDEKGTEPEVDQPAREADGDSRSPESNEEFTTLDNLMIKTVVASAIETDGSLAPDALEDLVQEVLSLSAERHRSYFHLGYLDALLKGELRDEFSGANVSRRGWYFTGFTMGQLRSVQAPKIVQLVKNCSQLWQELLAEGPMSARMMLLPSLLPRFAETGEWRLLRAIFARTQLPADARRAMQICSRTYELAADLVRRGSTVEAVPLLEILLDQLEQSRTLPRTYVETVCAATLRKLGQAHLRAGRFAESKSLLTKALQHEAFPEAASARTDLGLANAGFRSLDFLLPKDDTHANETVIKALEQHIDYFNEALREDGRATNAHFVLGLIAFHRGRTADAERHFSDGLHGMLKKEQAYQTASLVDWTRFLLAILIAEQCEPARLNEVRSHVESAITSAAFFPLPLWTRLCRDLTIYDDHSLAETVVHHLLKKRGDAAYGLLKESGLLTKNLSLRTNYRQWLISQKLPPAQKAAGLASMLSIAFKDGSADEVSDILDALEGVVKCDANCIPDFLTLLQDHRGDILAVWDETDIDNMEAALLERIGNREQCLEVLQRMFYRSRADGDWNTVEDLLDQIEQLKVDGYEMDALRAQVEHLRPVSIADTPNEISLDGISVLYVGGNETQARYEEALKRELGKRYPGLSATFYYPGWNSNWHVHLEKLQRLMPRHDVVVINNFVRTQLGRKLRAACDSSIPWRGCTGHGRKSLLQAIQVAAKWVVAIRARDEGVEGARL